MKEFFYDKKVLITGHTGFKGTWLCILLKMMGANVIGYSLSPPSEPNLFELTGIENDINSVHGDVRDLPKLSQVMADSKPDIVIHMAAQSLVRKSYIEPVETYGTNVMGTVNLLEALRKTGGVRSVINVTSDKCYENREWIWGYREGDSLGGHDPYSNSKGCSEFVTSSYLKSFFNSDKYEAHGTALASARAGNVIGGGDFADDRLIPDMVRAFMNNERVNIRNQEAMRPWQHVLEPLSGYLLLAKNLYENGPQFNGAWNFGPRNEDVRSVGYVADHFSKMWGESAGWIQDTDSHPHEASILKLDCSKAQSILGWHQKLNVQKALEWTYEWYKLFRDSQKKLRAFTERQIAGFLSM